MAKTLRNPKKENLSLWNSYHSMKKRCLNPNCKRYKDYGGRGIKICEEWLKGFDAFADWAKANGYRNGLTIERKDVNGNYEPDNCIWITKQQQAFNKRDSIFVTYRGRTKDLMVWCNELGLTYDTFHNRITCGWSPEKAFESPANGKSFAQVCREHGLKPATVRDRVYKLGWDLEVALNTPSAGLGANQQTYMGRI
ncbi:hypothetical protein [Lacrimispora indolis]|uniref:hypothetical protein n=1 Tax=Lacrimispora indolis TaxID=69825 RepID=UPI00045E812D|nr:hypothetical protein [Lacrimispora indolis]